MKKLSLIVIALLITFCASAQIQRKFMGFTFGLSTKSEVLNYAKQKHKEYRVMDDDNIYVRDLVFAGDNWHMTAFTFYHNKLYMLYFSNNEDFTLRSTLDLRWERLKDTLNSKYYRYLKKDDSSDSVLTFDDGRSILVARYEFFEGRKSLTLMYYDLKTFLLNSQEDNDEL